MGKGNVRNRFRFHYRFTFFQRQFLSHLTISLSVLLLLGLGATYYIKHETYKNKEDELKSASRAVIRLLQQEENPADLLAVYRAVLSERGIFFVVLDKSGEVILKDPRMQSQAYFRSKTFLDSLRQHMYTNDAHYFIIEKQTAPLMVWPRVFKANTSKTDAFLFMISPVQGVKETLRAINQTIVYTAILVFALAMLASWVVSRSMSRGVKGLQRATQRIAAGDYAVRTEVRRSDELGDLARDFNSMAEQLEHSSRKLEQYEERRRQFIMDVTHELRTPLTSIRGIIEGLKNNLVSEPQDRQKYYAIVEKETFRLIRLINELLDTEKIQSGLITLHPLNHNVRELLEVVAESLEVLIAEKNLALRIDCPQDLQVYGDYDRLTQILLNLVKNSIQFTEYGTIRLSAWESDTSTMIRIQDTGKGMTPQELELIWERFYKADPSRSKDRGETGLGLSIVKNLVEAHHGTIEVESTPGIGTTFLLSFPKMAAQQTQRTGTA